jgi:hypothetical protein
MAWIEDYGGSDFNVSYPTKHVRGNNSNAPERCIYISYINTHFKSIYILNNFFLKYHKKVDEAPVRQKMWQIFAIEFRWLLKVPELICLTEVR